MAEKGEDMRTTPLLQSTQNHVRGFPTIIMFSPEQEGGYVYNGQRNADALQTAYDALKSARLDALTR